MNCLINKENLYKILNDDNLIIVDCRFNLEDTEYGYKMYKKHHIPNAFYLHLDLDMSGEVDNHGGRHPIPNIDDFSTKIGEIGIAPQKFVVAYDDQGGAFASRLWWLLRYMGHKNVSVLDTNYSNWVEEQYPKTEVIPKSIPCKFVPHINREMLVDIDYVKQNKNSDNVVLIDSRAPERYKGEVEPIDKKAGHIPGAKNMFFKENKSELNDNWKSVNELENRFAPFKDKDLIVYCGSGVTATVNILALKTINKDAKLYAGGWSDWSSYSYNPVETDIK